MDAIKTLVKKLKDTDIKTIRRKTKISYGKR